MQLLYAFDLTKNSIRLEVDVDPRNNFPLFLQSSQMNHIEPRDKSCLHVVAKDHYTDVRNLISDVTKLAIWLGLSIGGEQVHAIRACACCRHLT